MFQRRSNVNGCVQSYVAEDGQSAIMIEMICDTDFYAKSQRFTEFVREYCKLIHDDKGEEAFNLILWARDFFKENVYRGRLEEWK